MKAIVVNPNEQPKVVDIDSDLESLQNIVKGLIQVVFPPSHGDSDVCLICNDEGKLMHLPLNRPLLLESGEIYDIVAGPFILCRAPFDSDTFESLRPDDIERFLQMYA